MSVDHPNIHPSSNLADMTLEMLKMNDADF